jgi:RNA polymerase sigma-70 factor (ECF subfamily)
MNSGNKEDNQRCEFATTHWSLVVAAGSVAEPTAKQALSELCSDYWYPLYSYVRRRTKSVDEAQDLTQSFFAHLLEKQSITRADPTRGRFRSFLLAALRNFLANEWGKVRTEKRGGAVAILSLDLDSGESRYQLEPKFELTPEDLFERRWVLTLLDQVLDRLQTELREGGRQRYFDELKSAITGSMTTAEYEVAAQQLGISTAAAKQAGYRMRKRYRQLFRDEVLRTLADKTDVDDEIGRILAILSK